MSHTGSHAGTSPPAAERAFDFTVVVPTYQRSAPLQRCLSALASLSYDPAGFEVIVVDDGSNPPVADLLPPDTVRPRHCRFLRQANAGPATARNLGAAKARGRWLAFTDDDCAPRPDWLDRFRRALLAQPRALVGGRCVNALPDNPWSTASQQLLDHLYASFNVDPDDARFFASMNFAGNAASYYSLGGFEQTFPIVAAEDRDFCDRWRHEIGPLIYVPEAVIDHAHAMNFLGFWKQHRDYGRGTPNYHRLRRRRGESRHGGLAPEPLRFYLGLLAYPLADQTGRPAAWLQAARVALSQLAYVSGYAWGTIRPPLPRTSPPRRRLEPDFDGDE